MSFSSSTAAWIAIAAAVVAVATLVVLLVLWHRLSRIRRAQTVVLGDARDDLVNFAVSLQARIDDLHRGVDEVAAGLVRVDRRVDGCLSRSAVVRFNAYEDTGGHQSSAFALLDGSRSGIVVSSIQGRDHARIYVKDVDQGRPSAALSPEEQEAIERAMAS
ncbi:MAG: DUF4446 family protein [Gaiellales bacterium]